MNSSTVDPNLLAMLVCPLTRTPLEYQQAQQVLISHEAKLVYHIREGIPVMLPTEATPLEQWLAQNASTPSAD